MGFRGGVGAQGATVDDEGDLDDVGHRGTPVLLDGELDEGVAPIVQIRSNRASLRSAYLRMSSGTSMFLPLTIVLTVNSREAGCLSRRVALRDGFGATRRLVGPSPESTPGLLGSRS